MALDAGTSVRLSANPCGFWSQVCRFLLAWVGACLSFKVGWDRILALELNSISAKMLGHQGLKGS